MFLAKAIRWNIATEQDMIPGGMVPHKLYTRAFFSKNMTPVLKFLHVGDADMTSAGLQKLEISLLVFITEKLKQWSYQRTVLGDIIFYLWEQYRYTRNISLILNTTLLDDSTIREKIVA